MTPNLHLWIIPLLPLAGAAINGVMGKRFSRRGVAAVGPVPPLQQVIHAPVVYNCFDLR